MPPNKSPRKQLSRFHEWLGDTYSQLGMDAVIPAAPGKISGSDRPFSTKLIPLLEVKEFGAARFNKRDDDRQVWIVLAADIDRTVSTRTTLDALERHEFPLPCFTITRESSGHHQLLWRLKSPIDSASMKGLMSRINGIVNADPLFRNHLMYNPLYSGEGYQVEYISGKRLHLIPSNMNVAPSISLAPNATGNGNAPGIGYPEFRRMMTQRMYFQRPNDVPAGMRHSMLWWYGIFWVRINLPARSTLLYEFLLATANKYCQMGHDKRDIASIAKSINRWNMKNGHQSFRYVQGWIFWKDRSAQIP